MSAGGRTHDDMLIYFVIPTGAFTNVVSKKREGKTKSEW